MALKAIKNCCQGKLHPVGEAGEDKDIKLDYVNTFNIAQSEDTLNCRADGKNVITISANKAVSFTVDMEVFDDNGLMLLLGATKDASSSKLIVGDTPATIYEYTGVFTIVGEDNTTTVKKMTAKKVKPQIPSDFGTSSLDLSTYSITFDILADNDGHFFTLEDSSI